MTIAGHTFAADGVCSCGKRFGDISGAAQENIGKEGFAHSGGLTSNELSEIQVEVARIWALVAGVASGSGPADTTTAADEEAWLVAEIG